MSSFHWSDNVHDAVFTPRDFQVELLAAAFERNIIACLGHKNSKEFIALKLLQELARQSRPADKINLYLTCSGATFMYTMLQHLTDIQVFQQSQIDEVLEILPDGYHVYVVHPRSCLVALQKGTLDMARVRLVILEDCHDMRVYQEVLPIISEFHAISSKSGIKIPSILGLAGPLHSAGCKLQELGAMLNTLEENVCCKAETASDVTTVLRYCAKPIEYIVQCAPYGKDELSYFLEDIINTRLVFLKHHRYDPSEIYNTDEFLEELKDIPDPKIEPQDFLLTMLSVLHEMGPWGADRVAMNMYHRIEKQKIRTPHERHYLLLCIVSTALVEIHATCERIFRKCSDHKECVERYSSPKVLRLLEVLRLFKPVEFTTENEQIKKINEELEQVDFQKLTRVLEHSCHSVENIAKFSQKESQSIIDNLQHIIKDTITATATSSVNTSSLLTNPNQNHLQDQTSSKNQMTENLRRHSAPHGRTRKRPFVRRHTRDNGDGLDTLCAIIFCNSNYTARALFDLLAEMSKYDTNLKFIKCLFTTDRVADPQTEPKEAEQEHRRQEEVLKRFRMHDCNILIGTSILEEGIDVPKCNLVVRWNPPATYRSYVQCKGRARAVPAYHVILVAPEFDINAPLTSNKSEQLSDESHKFYCKLDDDQDPTVESDSSDDERVKKSDTFIIGCAEKGTVKILNPEILTNQPPTATDIKLREIKDETLAIEDVTSQKTELIIEEFVEEITCNANDENAVKLKSLALEETIATVQSDTIQSDSENEGMSKDPKNDQNNCKIKSKNGTNTRKRRKPKRKFACQVVLKEDPEELSKKYDKMNIQQTLQLTENATNDIVLRLAQYRLIEKMLLEKCANKEPNELQHSIADAFTQCITPYKPLPDLLTGAAVDLSTSIALVNKYCSKLPSDTFTKLTALWRCASTVRNGQKVYQYTIRLPINSPLKYDIVGLPMSSNVLARRIAALQACIELHRVGELDNNLQPIGKEGFRPMESDWENFELEPQDEQIVQENTEPRPGTTKRRQYYYKRIASAFSHCRPTAGAACYLYLLDLTLQCPIPEEQNTRGRKIYPPEDAQQGFGILTLKKIPKVSAFPIFTRSGEVKVSIELSDERVYLTESQIRCINTFLNYTFTNVLRLQKFLMLFDPESTENCIFIVPTIKTKVGKSIDWKFLELIEQNASKMPTAVPEDARKSIEFDGNKFKDAVVMPWYRNQDQPQYFYVAEICPQLSPLSCFPGENYHTFKHYYFVKYGLTIQNSKQPLLDVDHTSARLNFLTPRYVNRKGVALPTSSEETKRAKRENLEQKQILVPELCTVHPFPASLWRTAVCLPCILYRINGLLLADEIRKMVSADIGLGQQKVKEDFNWPMLDFGWSLSEVLRKSREMKSKMEENREFEANGKSVNGVTQDQEWSAMDEKNAAVNKQEKSANEIVIEGEKKLQETFIEIGTWSNDMANNMKNNSTVDEDEEDMKYLPPNVSLCDHQMRYGSPTFWDYKKTDIRINSSTAPSTITGNYLQKPSFTYYDSDDSFTSSEAGIPTGNFGYESEDDDSETRIAYTSRNEAETIETEEEIEKRNKQLAVIQAVNANERNYQETKNLRIGYDFLDLKKDVPKSILQSIEKFVQSTQQLEREIKNSRMLITYNKALELVKKENSSAVGENMADERLIYQMLPYVKDNLKNLLNDDNLKSISVDTVAMLNQNYLDLNRDEVFTVEGCGDVFDNFNDKNTLQMELSPNGEVIKRIRLDFKRKQPEKHEKQQKTLAPLTSNGLNTTFSFDYQPDLSGHPGPSPSIILQALTMSNANDGINLERLETIGDSFLKYAITTYLYITYENVHEGKLSHLRSKQVANLNLYRLGRRKKLGEYMIATKFEPHDNWLPPCYYVPKELEKALIEAKIPPHHWKLVDLPNIKKLSSAEICELVREKADCLGLFNDQLTNGDDGNCLDDTGDSYDFTCFMPYNLVTQHSIPDKSVADCVEALIGAYLIECGPRGALLFMAWLGIRVLPYIRQSYDSHESRVPGSTNPDEDNMITIYGEWVPPNSPLLHYTPNAEEELELMLEGFDEFENILGYKFNDRSYLLQAMTHASYSPNRLTDCYQRLEFLGDAVLDYLITRHLYEDPRQHSPGALTDLRSALVNNTIFASLAVRHGFHKYFRHLSPGLNEVIDRFVRIQNENGHIISEEYYLLSEEECDDAEDVEVPKALGDVFESVAGAIFLDSNMSLDVVWKVYSNMMKPEIEQFSNSVPKSPIRELLELEPETAKFGKPEKLADGRRVRVTVDVFCKGTFRGIGRNYRIAKCTAAKCALRQLKKQGLISKKE